MKMLEQILQKDNLNEAYKRVYANKGAKGVDGITIEQLKEYLKEHKETIVDNIRKRKYKPQPVKRVKIPKDNGKTRDLGIPTVVDRVIQQAILQVVSPIFEKQFSESSYGFRMGRSCEMAITRSLEIINDGYIWVVDIDLERFFDTVNHDRLITLVSNVIKDGDVVSLIKKFLISGVMVGNKIEATDIGTPQGGNISPLLSNIMLNELDKELEARGLNFVRYADDCNIYLKSEKAANRVMTSITDFIERKLGLTVNVEKSKITKPTNSKFLGFSYYFDNKENKYLTRPHKLSIAKLKRKLKQLTKRSWSVSLDYRLLKIKQLIVGWVNYFRIAKMKTTLKIIDRRLRMRIRVVIWKQWKKTRKRYESLKALGATTRNAWVTANCRKGYQFVCKSATIHATITDKRLTKRGLASLLAQLDKVHITS